MNVTPYNWLIFAIASAAFGACIGSFLNVCIYRLPLNQSVIKPRSHCMLCGHIIPWYQNLPIFSYFLLRGKCAKCKHPFSFRYAAIELLTAFLFVAIFCMCPPCGMPPPFGLTRLADPVMIIIMWIFVSGLIVGSFIDLDHLIIPDSITIGGIIIGLIASMFMPSIQGQSVWWRGFIYSVAGIAAGSIPLQAIRLFATAVYRKKGRIGSDEYAMGFGDIKLIGAVGAILGWSAALFSITAAAFLGTIVAIPFLITGRRQLLDRIPFGPYISLGAIIWLLWGRTIINLYISLFIVNSGQVYY